MRKLFLVMAFMLCSLNFAHAANQNFDTHLYIYDAATGGNVTANTKQFLIFLGIKGTNENMGNRSSELSFDSWQSINIYDFVGNSFSLTRVSSYDSQCTTDSTGFIFCANAQILELPPIFSPKGDGESIIKLGLYNLTPLLQLQAAQIPQKGLIINWGNQLVYWPGNTNAQYLRASTLINFTQPASNQDVPVPVNKG